MPRTRPPRRPAVVPRALHGIVWWSSLAALLFAAGTGLRGEANKDADEPLPEALVAVRIEGNHTISEAEISKHIKTRPGRPASQKVIKEDVEALVRTRWFAIVEPTIRQTEDGPELVYRVVERPIVRSVSYLGLKPPNGLQKAGIRMGLTKDEVKKLEALTGLKKGSPYDIAANKECARRIEQMYHEKGYAFATVELEKGDKRDDREVVFRIDKGPKVHVVDVDFVGNKFFSDPVLKLKLRTKERIAWVFGGKYDPATIPDDIQALSDYYRGLGFFDVKIQHELAFSDDKSKAYLKYKIDEGPRYKIRQTFIEGNQIFTEEQLRQELTVKDGEAFDAKKLSKDVETVRDKYGELGRLFAKVDAVPRFLEEPGVVDLVYRIDEDKVYRIRDFRVHIEGDHPHSKVTLPRNIARIHPGDLADPKKIKATQRYYDGSGYFETNQSLPGHGVRLEVSRVNEPWIKASDMEVARGQNGPNIDDPNEGIVPVQGRGPLPGPQRYLHDDSPKGDPLVPAIRDPDPNIWENLPPPEFIDIDAYLTEARTGRLMFGVGVNSNAGLIGNIVFSENNFDILRPPTSWSDLWNGNAWRGAGQKFRIEALPGTQVSRYLVDWQDPYFLDTDYNLGLSGFYYNRYFRNWTEQRVGGRVRLGRQFTQQWSASVSFRLENVDIFNPTTPSPPLLAEAVGSNFLSTVQAQIIHDTRDAAFMPSDGHYIAASVEQAFAEFNYTRLDAEGRQYFTLYQRPDGAGKHTLMLRGEVGWTGNDTPIFERFYAGGFQSFRGFMFRGVTPVDMGVQVGGQWLTLGTAEYMFPVTANEMIKIVTFTDFGTVENNVTFNNFRLSVGAGLRLQVPMMGPVPIALDFAVPIMKQNFDRQQVFSFYIGANW
jgi:outer membrane protein insertion porin family